MYTGCKMNNKQQTINKQQTTNSKQQTTNIKQQTANNKQSKKQQRNNKQQTTYNIQHATYNKHQTNKQQTTNNKQQTCTIKYCVWRYTFSLMLYMYISICSLDHVVRACYTTPYRLPTSVKACGRRLWELYMYVEGHGETPRNYYTT